MTEVNYLRVSKSKLLSIGLHFCALVCIVTYQTGFILFVGTSVTIKGAFVFILQILVYLISVTWLVPTLFEKGRFFIFSVSLIFVIVVYEIARGLIIFSLFPLEVFFSTDIFS